MSDSVTPSPSPAESLRELAERATPGAWRVTQFTGDVVRVMDVSAGFIAVVSDSALALPGKIRVPAICGQPNMPLEAESRADAAYIAAANPAAILELLDGHERTRRELIAFADSLRDEAVKDLREDNAALRAELDSARAALREAREVVAKLHGQNRTMKGFGSCACCICEDHRRAAIDSAAGETS